MGAPKDTRTKILGAAQRLIEAGGIMRLTTKEIAREAGCAEGTLFKHFKRKEDICLAVVLENAPRFRESVAKQRPGESTVARNLANIGLAAIDFFEKLIPLSVSLFADVELLMRHRRQMAEQKRGPQDVFELISDYVKAEQRLQRIRSAVAPSSAVALLLGPCFHRAFIRTALGRDLEPISDKAFVSAIVETLLSGFDPRGRNSPPPAG